MSQLPSDIPSLINQILHTKDLEALTTSLTPYELEEALQVAFTRLSIATASREHEWQACKEQGVNVDGCMTKVPELDRLLGSREDLGDVMSDEERRKDLYQVVKSIIALREDTERLRLRKLEGRGRQHLHQDTKQPDQCQRHSVKGLEGTT